MALPDVVNLSIVLVHLVLCTIYLLLIGIPEPFVLGACRQGEVSVVQVLKVNIILHLEGASGDGKALVNLVVTGISHFLEGLVLSVVPGFQQVAQSPPVLISGWQKAVHLILCVLF